ncbi:MAG TPA: hypothetical protein VGM26_12360 [Rhizomicrobium sp.]|jgi:hypothetical protein
MSVYNAELHCMMPSPAPATATASASKASNDGEGFFGHILDIINPLQHLPVVGTVYRAITGDHIGNFEKIAGDTLYGGLWGAVTSVADVAFEGLTGKSVEDTMLAWLKSDDAPNTMVASANIAVPTIASDPRMMPSAEMPALPADTQIASTAPAGLPGVSMSSADVSALTAALSAKGVDNDTASRALYAYRRSMGMAQQTPVLATIN